MRSSILIIFETETPYPCHWFPTSPQMVWDQCLTRQSARVQKFTLKERQYNSLKWSCVKDASTGENPDRICGKNFF